MILSQVPHGAKALIRENMVLFAWANHLRCMKVWVCEDLLHGIHVCRWSPLENGNSGWRNWRPAKVSYWWCTCHSMRILCTSTCTNTCTELLYNLQVGGFRVNMLTCICQRYILFSVSGELAEPCVAKCFQTHYHTIIKVLSIATLYRSVTTTGGCIKSRPFDSG